MIQLVDGEVHGEEQLVGLYESVGWTAYLSDPAGLRSGVAGSGFVVGAWDGAELVGLARGLSDDYSIFYLQDVLVRPEHQGGGLGRRLVERCLDRYAHVRQAVLLADAGPGLLDFYEGLGFASVTRHNSLDAFVLLRTPEKG